MQLYMVAIQVKHSVVRPRKMVWRAFSGLTGILNVKNSPRAMCALRMVCTVLLSDFLYKDGNIPTFADLSIFLEKAYKTPTGQLWVDCLWLHTCLLELNEKVTGSCMCTASIRCFPTSMQLSLFWFKLHLFIKDCKQPHGH